MVVIFDGVGHDREGAGVGVGGVVADAVAEGGVVAGSEGGIDGGCG